MWVNKHTTICDYKIYKDIFTYLISQVYTYMYTLNIPHLYDVYTVFSPLPILYALRNNNGVIILLATLICYFYNFFNTRIA